jgi:hypothetical protein
MSVSIENAINFNVAKGEIPLEFRPTMMQSNDMDILTKKQREIIPRELSSFGYQTAAGVVSNDTLSNKTTFYVSDPRMYLDMLNSYFTADFRAVATTAVPANLPAFMSIGGIHACIKTLTIKIGGTVLMRLDDYNKWYNINNLATHSKEYSDYMLAACLDGQDDFGIERDYIKAVTYTVGNGVSVTAAGALTLVGGAALSELQVGDELAIGATIGGVVNQVQYTKVIAVGGDLAVTVEAGLTAVTGVDANNRIQFIRIIKRLYSSTRSNVINQANTVRVQWRLPVGCLSFLKYFPLPYIQDIAPLEIEFEWVDPRLAICLRDSASAAADNRIGYLVSRPRLVAMMVEPSNKVREMHDAAFNGNGIWFPYLNYRHFQNKINANDTDVVFTFQTNVSSARHIFSVLTSQANDDANTVATQAAKSQSTFYKSSMNYFRFQSGSLQFPDYGNCITSSYMSAEAWAQLLLAFNIKENTVHKSRIEPFEWQSNSSEKFIIGVPLAKDETLWTGTSLSNNFLELSINKAAVAVAYNVHTFLGADTALCIAKSVGCRIFD